MYFRIFLLCSLCVHFSLRPMLRTALSLVPLTLNVGMKYLPGAKDTLSAVLPTVMINLLHYPTEKTTFFRWTTTPWPILGTFMFCNPYAYPTLQTVAKSTENDAVKILYKTVISLGITMFAFYNILHPLHQNKKLNKDACLMAIMHNLLLYGMPIGNLCLS